MSASVSGKEDKLTFEYDEDNKVSAINGSALAGQGGTTYTPGQYINIDSNNEISVTGLVAADEYATYSGDWNDVSNSYKTNSGSFLTSEALTNYATKTYVDGKDPVLIGDSNITAASSTVDGHTQWNLAVNVTPVVTDTKLVGDNCVTAHTTQTSGEWIVGLEQTAYEAIGYVGGISTDVTTLKNASANWNKVSDKLDTTAAAQTYLEKATYSNASGKWENASNVVATNSANWDAKVDQSVLNDYLTKTQYGTDSATFALKTQLDDYATKEYANNASANALSEAETWVENKHYLTEVPNTYATKTDLNTASSTLTGVDNELSGHIDYISAHAITSLDNYYTKTQVDSTFALKTDTSSKTEITNALNTKVDKPTSIQTGKLVYDNDTSAWVSLPAGTTTIVQGQGSVTANYDSSNSTYTVSLLSSAENALNKVADKIDTTAVAQTYQAKSDMTNYLTTSDASNTYQPKGNYATTTDISDMATQTWVGQQGFYTKASGDNDYAPKSVTATINTLTAASAGWNNKVDKPTSLTNKYLVLRTDGNGDVSGWSDLQEQCYSKTEATGTFVHRGMLDNGTGGTLSGTGLTGGSILGVNTNVIQTKLTNEQLSAISSVSGKQDALTQAQLSAISSVSSKLDTSALTINTATNDITLATGPSTSASISAVNYKRNYSEALLVPQRIVVATSDDDIVQHINYYSDGQYGTIIFVTSAHTY